MGINRNSGPEDSGTLGFSLIPHRQLAGYLRDLRHMRTPISGRIQQAFAYLVGVQAGQSAGEPIGQPMFVQVDSQGRLVTTTASGSDVVQLGDGTTPTQLAAVSAAGAVKVDGSAVTQPVSGTFWQATQPVSGTVTANAGAGPYPINQAVGTVVTGGITAAAQTVTANNLAGLTGLQFMLSGTYATGATIALEASPDGGTTWVAVAGSRADNAAVGTSLSPGANATIVFDVYTGGATAFRVRCSAWAAPTGTMNVTINPFPIASDPWVSTTLVGSGGSAIGNTSTGSDAQGGTTSLSTAGFGYGFNGVTWDRLRSLSAAGGGIGVLLTSGPPTTPKTQSATHADNLITVAATAAQKNRLMHLSGSVYGAGVMPTAAAPLQVTIKDGATAIFTYDLTAGGPFSVAAPAGGWIGSTNTALNIDIPDGGANVSTDLNVAYVVG